MEMEILEVLEIRVNLSCNSFVYILLSLSTFQKYDISMRLTAFHVGSRVTIM